MLKLATSGPQDDGFTLMTGDGPVHIQINRELGARLTLSIQAPSTVQIFRDRMLRDLAERDSSGYGDLWEWAREMNPRYRSTR